MRSLFRRPAELCWCAPLLCLAADVLPPHAVADDLGFGDLGYTGSAIRTPHIDDLAHNGTVLGHYYVMHCCSPTRSAL